jgi:hypothetical protein
MCQIPLILLVQPKSVLKLYTLIQFCLSCCWKTWEDTHPTLGSGIDSVFDVVDHRQDANLDLEAACVAGDDTDLSWGYSVIARRE